MVVQAPGRGRRAARAGAASITESARCNELTATSSRWRWWTRASTWSSHCSTYFFTSQIISEGDRYGNQRQLAFERKIKCEPLLRNARRCSREKSAELSGCDNCYSIQSWSKFAYGGTATKVLRLLVISRRQILLVLEVRGDWFRIQIGREQEWLDSVPK